MACFIMGVGIGNDIKIQRNQQTGSIYEYTISSLVNFCRIFKSWKLDTKFLVIDKAKICCERKGNNI